MCIVGDKVEINKFIVSSFTDRSSFLDYISDKKKILIAINAEKLMKDDQQLKQIINNNIGYPDGVGVVLALKKRGIQAIKIAGAEFWLNIIERYKKDKTFYFIGSSQKVIEKTISQLNYFFPGIKIVGYRDGYLDSGQKSELVNDLRDKIPDIVFVAQGSPRQEYLMSELFNHHPALYMGLGGSFDIYSGYKKRAPKIFIKLGLEWFYRLVKEPTRISRQINLVKFIYLLFRNKL